MALVQFLQDAVHDGVADQCGTGSDFEALAEFVDGGKFHLIEKYAFAVFALEGVALPVQIGGIHAGKFFLFPCHIAKIALIL